MKFFALSLLPLLASINSFACSCTPHQPFLEYSTSLDTILYIKVLKNNGDDSVDAQVLEAFKGAIDNPKIKILGNVLCGPNLAGFNEGTEWIMPLSVLDEPNQYVHASCAYSLLVENSTVTGYFSNYSQQTYTLEEFKNVWTIYHSGLQLGWAQCLNGAASPDWPVFNINTGVLKIPRVYVNLNPPYFTPYQVQMQLVPNETTIQFNLTDIEEY